MVLKKVKAENVSILIGLEFTSTVQELTAIGAMYEVPMLSAMATGAHLSNKESYPTFWRTTAPDDFRMQAWIDFAEYHQWLNVVILLEANPYSRGAGDELEKKAKKKGIKITKFMISSPSDVPRVLSLVRETKIKIIFAPCINTVEELVKEAKRTKMIGRQSFLARKHDETITIPKSDYAPERKILLEKNVRKEDSRVQGYIWMFGDSTGSLIDSQFNDIRSGIFSFLDTYEEAKEAYERKEYERLKEMAFEKVKLDYNAVNISNPFRIPKKRASMESSMEKIYSSSNPTSLARCIMIIYDIVNQTFHENGGSLQITPNQMKEGLRNYRGRLLGSEVSFDEKSQDPANPKIILVNPDQKIFFKQVGDFSKEKGLKIEGRKGRIVWPDGTTRIPDDGVALEAYVFPLSGIGVTLLLWATVVEVGAVATLVVQIFFWKTPVFRLASPIQLLLILIGVTMLNLYVYAAVGRPTGVLCSLRNVGYHLGIAFIFVPLNAKIFRVFMVFRQLKRLKSFVMTNQRLLLITACGIVPQIFISLSRVSFAPMAGVRAVLVADHSRVDVACDQSALGVYHWGYAQLAYSCLLCLLALFFAYLTRQVPRGFNESKFVFFAVYSAISMIVLGQIFSRVLIFAGASIAASLYSFSTLIFSSSVWICIFWPKIYIIFFAPHLNSKALLQPSPHSFDILSSSFSLDVLDEENLLNNSSSFSQHIHLSSQSTGLSNSDVLLSAHSEGNYVPPSSSSH